MFSSVVGSGSDGRRLGPIVAVAALLAGLIAPPVAAVADPSKVDPGLLRIARQHPATRLHVIVRETKPQTDVAERVVRDTGGQVTRELGIVGGFAAILPASALDDVAASDAVLKVWGDARLQADQVDMGCYDWWPENTVWRATVRIPQAIGARKPPYSGKGVTVAVLDTGISNTPDLGNRVLARVDLTPDLDGYDRYGHGTHMAGIIAGGNKTYPGVASGANIVSVKVAGWDGSTDVSVVIAGLEWIVAHKADYNIRIVNLAFGTDSRQSYSIDPLDYAVEQTWFAGIFVVVSAGNHGTPGTISKPGDDPYVLTVGAADLRNTRSASDDVVASFSSLGPTQDGYAKPDLVAPGVTIVSTLASNSTVAATHPAAIVSSTFIKGTGTSQAAAVVSGIAALLVEADPTLTPDRLKTVLVTTASQMGDQVGSGAGLVDADNAIRHLMGNRSVNTGLTPSTGLGSLEASRGSLHVVSDPWGAGTPVTITGEMDVLGQTWDARSWSGRSWSSEAWLSSGWADLTVVNAYWGTGAWSGRSWSGTGWDARSWSARSWSTSGFTAEDWTGRSWSSQTWS